MALVAYDYDSTSEIEDDEENNTVLTIPKSNETDEELPNTKIKIESELKSENNLFSNLPQTKISAKIIEEQIEEFIPKSYVKEKRKIKITVPALSQFIDDDEEPDTKKLKPSVASSGLLSLLPPVKGSVTTNKSFIPNIVATKSKHNIKASNANINNVLVPNAVRKQAETRKATLLRQKEVRRGGSDIESDDDMDVPETFDDEMWEKVCGRQKPKQTIIKMEEPLPQQILNIAPEPEKPYEGLDNGAFKELVGKSKRPIGNIKLIDINEEEILSEKDLWMTKSLTDPEMAPKPQEEDPVDPTRRKKHHITYLAQQAKANEQELQNAWSASKNNRLATRAKYGF